MSDTVVIGLSAVIVALQDGEACVMIVRPGGVPGRSAAPAHALPFGPFDPAGQRTFELALRDFVTRQTRFDLGYVEQLYTFGDKGRDAPLADVGAGAARVISVGYLALAPLAVDTHMPGASWSPLTRFFPWEDWRSGRPEIIDDAIAPALAPWIGGSDVRRERAKALFALDGAPWNEERVLDRYELLYEAGLAAEATRDRRMAEAHRSPELEPPTGFALGEPMISDHRRILATGLARLRGKLKYRPVIFELMGEEFTLSTLQRAVESVSGLPLHKQNFRRVVERTGLVEGLGRMAMGAGGRPAELFRFRRDRLRGQPALGLSLPRLRE
jgi:hypothetical protein